MSRQPQTSSKGAGKAGESRQQRVRGAIGRTFMSIGVLRRWYVRRTLKFIDKSRAKGRRLPEGMADTARTLSRLPKQQRAKALEDAILTNQEMGKGNMGRDVRRAAARQRRSGKSDARYRPGLPPGTIKQARRGPR